DPHAWEHTSVLRRGRICRRGGRGGGALGRTPIVAQKGLGVQSRAAQVYLVLGRRRVHFVAVGVWALRAVLPVDLYAAVFLDDPESGQVYASIPLVAGHPVRVRNARVVPTVSGGLWCSGGWGTRNGERNIGPQFPLTPTL